MDNSIIAGNCIVGAHCQWCFLYTHDIKSQPLIKGGVLSHMVFLAATLFRGKKAELFGMLHHRITNPLVIGIEIGFEEDDSSKFVNLIDTWLLFNR